MNFIQDILRFVRQLLDWWFIVEPWEQAVRVRLGKHVRLFEAGVHVRIPFFDTVYVQNVRRRVGGIPLQTLTTADGHTITLEGNLAYRIADVLKLQRTLHDADASVRQEVLGLISDYVAKSPIAACTPSAITESVRSQLDLAKYGLADVDFFLAGFVSGIPCVRLIQDSISGYVNAGTLSTQESKYPVAPRG